MPFPCALRDTLAHARIDRQTIGESDAAVWRLTDADGACRFLKAEAAHPLAELPAEVARLRWMRAQGLPCPEVLQTLQADGRHWLLMSAVPGRDLASTPDLSPQRTLALLAHALQRLHQTPPAACPFDHRLALRVAEASRRARAGLVDVDNFDPARQGQAVEALLRALVASQPPREDLVVTHGDACLPNFMVAEGRFSGFIDCARLGVADRHQDLALTARSIERNLGPEWLTPFFTCYGIEPDPARLAFYCLLDEFF
ncbi:APH(3')-II family aminoglycoside O-phosphotransferase [Bordetella trematum]|uniref:APH(3')-II family aminoglycoside O-phosphotransferase n=1 Tax=Bordetella trematum TaxID=123899 RepID=UPI003D144B86